MLALALVAALNATPIPRDQPPDLAPLADCENPNQMLGVLAHYFVSIDRGASWVWYDNGYGHSTLQVTEDASGRGVVFRFNDGCLTGADDLLEPH